MNRRGFLKGLAAAAVVAKVGFYAVADKIVTPAYAAPIVIADGAASSGWCDVGNGWYRCWATWKSISGLDNKTMTQSMYIKSVLDREKNQYPVPMVQYTRPPAIDSYKLRPTPQEAGFNAHSPYHLPWGVQLESGPSVYSYIKSEI